MAYVYPRPQESREVVWVLVMVFLGKVVSQREGGKVERPH